MRPGLWLAGDCLSDLALLGQALGPPQTPAIR
jgi:hypothetical protein